MALRATLVSAILVLLAAAAPAGAVVLPVTETADNNDGSCTPTDCSLREAVIRANTDAAEDVITLPEGTFPITGALGEDAAASGDFDITQPVIVRGAGSGTVIDANLADRIFHVIAPVSFTLETATLTRGDPGTGDDALGGAIRHSALGGALLIRGVTFTINRAVPAAVNGQGGAVFAVAVDTTIEGSTFTFNIAGGRGGLEGFGGAVATSGDASLIVRDSTFSENGAGGDGNRGTGGAVYTSAQSSITIERTLFSRNSAGGAGGDGFGGGLLIDSSGGLTTISASTFTGNVAGPGAGGFGGAMDLKANGTEVINTTVTGNTASGAGFTGLGGGVANETSAAPGVRFLNSTIAGNSAGSDAGDVGGVYHTTRPTSARNTIIAQNGGSDCDTPIQNSEGNNLESGTACGFTAPGDQQAKDPLLGPLAGNGGPTPTRALLPESPARNAGSGAGCPAQDQRGIARPQETACDIGAFEFVPPLVEPPPATDAFAPEITGARVTNAVWAVNRRGTRETPTGAQRRVRLGTTFVYSLSEPARVVFAFQRRTKGRRVGGRCRRPTRRNRGRRRCTRFVRAGAFAHQSVAGANRKAFSGRIGRRRLRRGPHRVTLTATDEAGNRSRATRLAFRVVKAPRRR